MKKIKVLVVDDSLLFRRTIIEGISKDPNIEVVAMAADPYEARDQIIKYKPDVMTLDVEMPRMNGIEFLKRLMPQYPLPTIMVSAVDNKVFEAMKYGALDFVVKSNIASNNALEDFINNLIEKIKIASKANLSKPIHPTSIGAKPIVPSYTKKNALKTNIILLGASTGGTEATEKVLSALSKGLPPILITQHMPPVFTDMYAKRLDRNSAFHIKEAESGDILMPGCGYVAPGDYHLKIVKTESHYILKCVTGEKVNGHIPSVDVMFNSAAKYFGSDACAILLTGMGNDGAKGMANLHQNGAYTIAQDESTSVVYGMPKQAVMLGAADEELPLNEIAHHINHHCLS